MNFNEYIFREYDVRGEYPIDINENFAYLFGRGYGSFVQEKFKLNTCVVGYDNRFSSVSLMDHLIKGILSTGMHVVSIGLVTTPMVYFARDFLHTKASIMVTASHNPKDDNGFKFSYNENNATGEEIYALRDFIKEGKFIDGEGTLTEKDITKEYYKTLLNHISLGDKKLKVVIDCGNGTPSFFVKDIFSSINIDPVYLYCKSDPSFPNHHPDPSVEENVEKLKEIVVLEKANLGVSFDGDGDRCCCVDDLGRYVKSDQYMAIVIQDILKEKNNKKIVYDVKCSNLLKDQIQKLKGIPFMYRTGASYTLKKTIEENAPFGGEYSGHLYFNDKIKANSCGMYAALRMIEFLSKNDKSLSEEVDLLNQYYATPEIKYEFDEEKKKQAVEEIKKYCTSKGYTTVEIDGVKVLFDDGSWALIRMSNTGPHVTVRYEAKTEERLEELKKEFTAQITKN